LQYSDSPINRLVLNTNRNQALLLARERNLATFNRVIGRYITRYNLNLARMDYALTLLMTQIVDAIEGLRFESVTCPAVKLHLEIAREMHVNVNGSRNFLLTDCIMSNLRSILPIRISCRSFVRALLHFSSLQTEFWNF